jgi:hypothetical protein
MMFIEDIELCRHFGQNWRSCLKDPKDTKNNNGLSRQTCCESLANTGTLFMNNLICPHPYFLLTFWSCRTPTEDLLLFLLTARLQLAYGAFSNMRLHPERLGLIRSFRLGLLEPAHSLRQVLLLELIPLLALFANGLAAPQVSVFVLLY